MQNQPVWDLTGTQWPDWRCWSELYRNTKNSQIWIWFCSQKALPDPCLEKRDFRRHNIKIVKHYRTLRTCIKTKRVKKCPHALIFIHRQRNKWPYDQFMQKYMVNPRVSHSFYSTVAMKLHTFVWLRIKVCLEKQENQRPSQLMQLRGVFWMLGLSKKIAVI